MKKLNARDLTIFAFLGALMYASKEALSFLPNIHILAPIICAITVVYRGRALYPIYIFVLLTGLFGGFNLWWIPYLYIWTILWGAVMLLPRGRNIKNPLPYTVICALHGFLFGILYAPAQAILFGFTPAQTLAWIGAGLPYDAIHGAGNIVCSLLTVPLIKVLFALQKKRSCGK